jgi:uncharacterized OB-fold protein
MALEGQYLGMGLRVDDLDVENLEYFKHCAAHDFHLQACAGCGRFRYPPTTACPWCMSRESSWKKVEGKARAFLWRGASRDPARVPRKTPYLILLIDLDTRRASRPRRGIAVIGISARRMAARIARASSRSDRHPRRMVFSDVADGIALPQWTIDETAQQPARWRYPQE